MKKSLSILTALCLLSPLAQAASEPEQPVNRHGRQETLHQQIQDTTLAYAKLIACNVDGPLAVIPLKPWAEEENWMEAESAVLWIGDIGCAGGTGTTGIKVTSIKVGSDKSLYVDTSASSPQIEFALHAPASYEKLVSHTADTLVIDGREVDEYNMPGAKVRYTLKRDEKGNWKDASQR